MAWLIFVQELHHSSSTLNNMWTANLRREISDGEQDIFVLASFITQVLISS